jgi:hypothetical protein
MVNNEYKIFINSDDYVLCETYAKNMSCHSKPGTYGSGLLNNKNDPYKTERTGKLGEMALSKLLKLDVDGEYRKYGDEYDFKVKNCKIDIKTKSPNNYINKTGYITAINENGYKLPLKSNIYVFCYLEYDDVVNKNAVVIIQGWIHSDEITNLIPVPSPLRYAKHKNYEIDLTKLKPIDELLLFLN